MMPMDLVLVRHGDSEGNAFKRLQKRRGDARRFEDVFTDRHSSSFRLTDLGSRQAREAGAWLRNAFPDGFDRCYTSSYLRAMETAARLELPQAEWFLEPCLRERDWGDLETANESERQELYAASLRMKEITPMYWIPPNGESIIQVAESRVYRMLGTLARECSDKRVIIVAHGETMWCFRLLLERIPEHRYTELDASTDRDHCIFNCQIIHYTRRDPATGAEDRYYKRMRMIRPKAEEVFNEDWRPIERRTFKSDELMKLVERQARAITDG
jgi:NAD+ kinase